MPYQNTKETKIIAFIATYIFKTNHINGCLQSYAAGIDKVETNSYETAVTMPQKVYKFCSFAFST